MIRAIGEIRHWLQSYRPLADILASRNSVKITIEFPNAESAALAWQKMSEEACAAHSTPKLDGTYSASIMGMPVKFTVAACERCGRTL